MHKAGELATQAGRDVKAGRSTEPSPTPQPARKAPLPETALDLIAATMIAAFGHRWTSIHGDNFAATSGRIWAIELAGLGQRAIARGLDLAVREAWPPVLADFKGMCIGVLPLTTVRQQRAGKAIDQQPFTVLVGRFISETRWRMGDDVGRDRMLQQAWEQARDHMLAGGALPQYTPAAQQLTVEDERPPPPPIMVTAAEAMEEIKRSLRIQPKPAPETLPPIGHRFDKPCKRCSGTRRDPLGDHAFHPHQRERGECLACYGSGIEAAYNRVVHEDGTTEERLP